MDKIHLKAPKGWINDPNGFIYYNGRYHLFYQHFPYAPQWGRMHWGHAISDDLTCWEHLDTALFPTKKDDSDGCFSGSAIEKDGRLHIFYTGVRYEKHDPENVNCCVNDKFFSAQLKITSEDGVVFDNFCNKRTVIPPIEDDTVGNINHARDPKVWQGKDGNYYMIIGSTVNGKGRILIWKSSDLENWEYKNYAEADDLGWMWECPDFFETDGDGVLICSPMGIEKGCQTVCMTAVFNETDCSMKINGGYCYFDHGLDLYAPQSTTDKEGRRTVIAWLRMPEKMNDNTIGMFCMPRVCEVENGHVYFRPHPDVAVKFKKSIKSPQQAGNGGYMFKTVLGDGDIVNAGGYIIGRKGNRVFTDRSAVIKGRTDIQNYFETPDVSGGFCVEVYIDEYIAEVYVNNGEYVITNAVYGLKPEIKCDKDIEIFTPEE